MDKTPLHDLALCELLTRHAFLAGLLSGARVVEAGVSGDRARLSSDFLRRIGAASVQTLDEAATFRALQQLPSEGAAPGEASFDVFILHDAAAWLDGGARVPALARLCSGAHAVLTLRDPGAPSIVPAPAWNPRRRAPTASLRPPSNDFERLMALLQKTGAVPKLRSDPPPSSDLPELPEARDPAKKEAAVERPPLALERLQATLKTHFASVQIAAQSAFWGCQLATLEGETPDAFLDDLLFEQQAPTWFLAICGDAPIELSEEQALFRLPMAALLADASKRDAREAPLRERVAAAERDLAASREQLHALQEVHARLGHQLEAEAKTHGAEVTSRKSAEEKLGRIEALLDELSSEREALLRKSELREEALARAEAAEKEAQTQRQALEVALEQARREREAQVHLSQLALKRFEEKSAGAEAALCRLTELAACQKARIEALEGANPPSDALKEQLLQRDARIAQLERALAKSSDAASKRTSSAAIDERDARIAQLTEIVARQDAQIEALEEHAPRLDALKDQLLQRDARIAQLDAALLESQLHKDDLLEEIHLLEGKVEALKDMRGLPLTPGSAKGARPSLRLITAAPNADSVSEEREEACDDGDDIEDSLFDDEDDD